MEGVDGTGWVMKDSYMTCGTILAEADADGRPTDYLDKNGITYTSALAMLKEGTTVLKEEIDEHKHLINNALNEYCILFTKAYEMTKYKKVQMAVETLEDNSNRKNEDDWANRVNDLIKEYIQELVSMAEEAKEFLCSVAYLVINKEAEARLQETLKVLESMILEVVGMDKTCKRWDEVYATAEKLAKAVYDFNWV